MKNLRMRIEDIDSVEEMSMNVTPKNLEGTEGEGREGQENVNFSNIFHLFGYY